MSVIKEDLREVILFRIGKEMAAKQQGKDWVDEITYEEYLKGIAALERDGKDMHDIAIRAMDEYFEARSMELLDHIANNVGEIDRDVSPKPFYYKGEWITAKELFQNFL